MTHTETALKSLLYGAAHPVEFINKLWPGSEKWQEACVRSVEEFWKTAVVTCNGAGKTWIAARIMAQFFITHPDAIVITTAGTWTQVRRQLWKEVGSAYSQLPEPIRIPKLNTTDWTISDTWYAVGLSTNDPHFFEGFHGKYVLVIVDEAKSVPQGIFDAINRIFAGKSKRVRLLIISSPGNAEGPHYEAFHEKAHLYSRISVNPFVCWHETPDGVRTILPPTEHLTEKYINDMKEEYGEDSPIFRSIVLALWSEATDFRLFTPSIIRDCRDDTDYVGNYVVKVGADVGRSISGDECSFYALGRYTLPDGHHYQVLGHEEFHTGDSTIFEDKLRVFCALHKAIDKNVNVDGTGIGGPSCDHLRKHHKFRVNEIQFAGSAITETPLLANMRADLWWTGAVAARQGRIHGLNDNRTIAQLTALTYLFDSRGRIQIEGKKEMARRIAKERPRSPWRSTDRGDSFLLAIFEKRGRRLSFKDAGAIYAS